MVKRFSLRFSLLLFLSDLVLVIVALLLATYLRINLPFGKPAPIRQFILPLPVYFMAPAIWMLTFTAANVYAPKQAARLIHELQTIVVASAAAWLGLVGALYLSYRVISRLQMIYFGVLALALIGAHRVAVRGFFKLSGGRSYDARRVLVVGTGQMGREVADMVRAYAWAGFYLVGFVSTDGADSPADTDPAVPAQQIVGRLEDVPRLVAEHDISEIIIALPAETPLDIRELVYNLQQLPVNLRMVPDFFDLAFLQLQVEDFGGMPLLTLKEPALTPFQRLVKRIFDLTLTTIGLIPALPLMGIIALAIKIDSPGPVFFVQERVGEGGKIFKMIKFRTMIPDAEQRRDEVITYDEEGNPIHKRQDDPRVTRVGRFLRRTSLDELPQLFNILRGEMSLVGPRPEMPWLVEKYKPWQRKRFEVPQGLTGWWQISGRADKPMHLHTEEDLFYIRNYSLWLDIKILWRTIGAVIARRGAY